VAVLLHLVAGLEDVLHDPQALLLADLQHLHLAAAADLDPRQVVGADVDRARNGLGQRHRGAPS
jgi:hypothetical protein